MKHGNKYLVSLIMISILLTSMNLTMSNSTLNQLLIANSVSENLKPATSTNSSNPENLTDNTELSENYAAAVQPYYYKTFNMTSFEMNLLWIYKTTTFDLGLNIYFDSSFSELMYSTATNPSGLTWVAYYPNRAGEIYPEVVTSIDTGNAYIEAEAATTVAIGNTSSVQLTGSDYVEIRQATILDMESYSVELEVPAGCDFDLHVFRVTSNFTKQDIQTSTSNTVGEDEEVIFSPNSGGPYAFVVIRKSGTGTANLTVFKYLHSSTPEPETYSQTDQQYRYKTYTMNPTSANLYVIKKDSAFDLGLGIYSDNDFSNQLYFNSTNSTGFTCVLYRPATVSPTWVEINTSSTTGNAYLGAIQSNPLPLGGVFSTGVDSNAPVNLAEASLLSTKQYLVKLNMDDAEDLDLLVCQINSGTFVPVGLFSNTSSVLGQDEQILFTVNTTGRYVFVIIGRTCSGLGFEISLELYSPEEPGIPGFDILAVLLGLLAVLFISLKLKKPIEIK